MDFLLFRPSGRHLACRELPARRGDFVALDLERRRPLSPGAFLMRMRPTFRTSTLSARVAWTLSFALLAVPASAQNASGPTAMSATNAPASSAPGRKALTIDDYSRWRGIEGSQI